MSFIRQGCPKVLAFMRTLGEERLLVVANLSRHPQATRLDLSAHAGRTPVEALGGSPFPPITGQPYPLTLTPHGCYILDLSAAPGNAARQPSGLVLRRADPGGVRFLDARLKAALQEIGLQVRPRPDSDVASVGVVAGTGAAGMRLTNNLPYLYPGYGYPDLLVVRPSLLAAGISGVEAAGFFGPDWRAETGEIVWR